jgi:group II intron reverse transcriptase/maturase
MEDTLRSQPIFTKLQEIANKAASNPDLVFTSLAHLIDVDFLWVAYTQISSGGAAGVDGVTYRQYSDDLESNLADLHKRLHERRYRAQPVRRAWIDKDDRSQRPLGIPALEDKIVQRAVVMILEAVYEESFYDFSHGFRKDHSPHLALKESREKCYKLNINWIVDADIRKFFDSIARKILIDIIKRRVNDGGIIRLIGKWLNAGVLDGEELFHPETGTPQGAVISPILANIFLHHVLDEWFVNEIMPRMGGRCFLIRFADDFVIGFEYESDARGVMAVLPKRFNRYELTIHADKTTLVDFRSPGRRGNSSDHNHSFNFLGFTHFWFKSRRGKWIIRRKTIGKRLRRAMKAVWLWCKENRHIKISEQFGILRSKLYGHYQYYGIRSNFKMIEVYYKHVRRAWHHWLSRRCSKGYISWDKFKEMFQEFPLPTPRIVQFDV